MRSLKHRIATYIISVLSVTAFSVTAVAALVWANGLKFDPTTKTFEQTVMIVAEAYSENVQVFLNNQKISEKLPFEQRSLVAGSYEIKITKDGYYDFYKVFNLKGGEIGLIKGEDFNLIAVNPKQEFRTLDEKANVTFSAVDTGFSLSANELYYKGEFVTRFSTVPSAVKKFNNDIVYATNDEIRYYSIKHNTDELIYKIPKGYSTNFDINKNDKFVTIYSTDALKAINIYFTISSEV